MYQKRKEQRGMPPGRRKQIWDKELGHIEKKAGTQWGWRREGKREREGVGSEREGKTEEARTAGPIGLAEELEGGGLLLCSKQGGGKEEMEDRDSGAWR